MKVLAIDPDTTTSGWAVVQHSGERIDKRCTILDAGLIKSKRELKGDEGVVAHVRQLMQDGRMLPWIPHVDMVVVEGQYSGSGTNNENMFNVAHVTGAFLALASFNHENVAVVNPKLWTQSWSKEVRMAKCRELWFHTPMEDVQRMAGCLPSELNHVLDGAGIGRWICLNHESVSWTGRNRKKTKPRRRR